MRRASAASSPRTAVPAPWQRRFGDSGERCYRAFERRHTRWQGVEELYATFEFLSNGVEIIRRYRVPPRYFRHESIEVGELFTVLAELGPTLRARKSAVAFSTSTTFFGGEPMPRR